MFDTEEWQWLASYKMWHLLEKSGNTGETPGTSRRVLETIALQAAGGTDEAIATDCVVTGVVSSQRCQKTPGTREEAVLGHAVIGGSLPRATVGFTLGATRPVAGMEAAELLAPGLTPWQPLTFWQSIEIVGVSVSSSHE